VRCVGHHTSSRLYLKAPNSGAFSISAPMSRTPTLPDQHYTESQVVPVKHINKAVSLTLPMAHDRQHYFIDTLDRQPEVRFAVGACGTKFGKGHPFSTLVPVPSGLVEWGSLRVGDYVFDAEGAPTRVEMVTEPRYDLTCYEVKFSDGSSVVVDSEHLWETQTHACRKAIARTLSPNDRCKSTTMRPEVVSTQHIKDTLTVTSAGKDRPNHSVDLVSAPVQFNEAELSLDPYVLGYWLGNGAQGCGSIACCVEDADFIREQFRSVGFECGEYTESSHTFYCRGMLTELRALGCSPSKNIPPQYLTASIEQRLALLQGLMDSDGCISKRGDCMFDNTNKDLADGVAFLAASLGLKVSREGRFGKIDGVAKKWCYRVFFTPHIHVFRLQRKLSRMRPVADKARRRYIVSVTEVPSEPTTCIRVANPRHLYLVGTSFTPTHNTFGSTIAIAKRAWDHRGSMNWWVAPTFSQSKMAFSLIKNLLPDKMYKPYQGDLKLVLLEPNGAEHSQIEFKSGDNPDSLRGFGVNFFVMDEAARCLHESWISLLTTVTQTRGRGFVISTPKGRGWFYDVYQKGVKYDEETGLYLFSEENPDPNPEWFSVRMPTWTNPHVQLDSIREMKKNLVEDVFRQEVGAQFLLDSAGVFRGITGCIKGDLQQPTKGCQYIMGVDLGRLKDYTVLTVMERSTRHVVAFERFNGSSWDSQYQNIVALARKYNANVYIDSTGIGDPIVETLSNARIKLTPYKISGSAAKQQLVDKLRVNIEQQRITFPMIPMLKRELENYEYEISTSGALKYSAPSGQHDDCVISLALANWGADQVPWTYKYSNVRGI
jgi:hypothetical protein